MITVALREGEGREAYDGPLDLLLALVRREGYPIAALPVGAITREYNRYLKEAGEVDIELGVDFIETASWLVLLKSRALLPAAPGEAGDEPARELACVLLDHAAVKRAAALLSERLDASRLESGFDFEREAGREVSPAEMAELTEEPTLPTVADALAAARRALAAAQAHTQAANTLPADAYPVDETLAALDARLRALTPGRGISTEPWFAELPAPEAQASLLLALLELARTGEVLLHQYTTLGPLLLQPVAGNAGGPTE